ncbi:2-hydroxy-6-oxononadienedioate/2-hydroxy-6-oxononatrienedioate hydrolase [Symmachiella macrocystis]|uniref:2-hydroxy-6-oxononadienedioate/2-hydroxy-6-oxononatrienedioate hydrolase n=1 Tax=Symmachiella macrocystis TaxID=2527985 RepID=A0A5C6BM81_9PLAN|nr:alpha/beta fold hydrolase [Symmachiella macrocystis]TWU12892.1 2-hydroxy-6-oxononadienedioate/2-hydroxy-6-oxononatrienedioate hydrolase [Symmachiella macrocystis]
MIFAALKQWHCLVLAGLLLGVGLHEKLDAADAFSEPIDVSFTAECDGTIQKYVVLLPHGFSTDQSYSLMVALHGHGSDRWQFATAAVNECRAARDVALKHEMIFVAPDYRAKTSWMGPQAEADMIQILEALKSKYKIDKTILVGASMGGSSSLSFAAMHPELIDGVAAMNGTANHLEYENFQDAIQASFGGSKQEIPAEYKRRSAEYWPERLTMPVAITTGGLDKSVPPDSCTRLAKVLKKLNAHVLHIHRPQGGHSTTSADAVKALDFVCERVLTEEKTSTK